MKLDPNLKSNIEGKIRALRDDLAKLEHQHAEISGAIKGLSIMLKEDADARKPKAK